jgi:hypothetical protein
MQIEERSLPPKRLFGRDYDGLNGFQKITIETELAEK